MITQRSKRKPQWPTFWLANPRLWNLRHWLDKTYRSRLGSVSRGVGPGVSIMNSWCGKSGVNPTYVEHHYNKVMIEMREGKEGPWWSTSLSKSITVNSIRRRLYLETQDFNLERLQIEFTIHVSIYLLWLVPWLISDYHSGFGQVTNRSCWFLMPTNPSSDFQPLLKFARCWLGLAWTLAFLLQRSPAGWLPASHSQPSASFPNRL
jgi:hypothetical protein